MLLLMEDASATGLMILTTPLMPSRIPVLEGDSAVGAGSVETVFESACEALERFDP
jgi:hypothetical protein